MLMVILYAAGWVATALVAGVFIGKMIARGDQMARMERDSWRR